ncbi:MAG: hypothetical protein ACRDDX_03015 [Cellulosilyticaceae bacterium]
MNCNSCSTQTTGCRSIGANTQSYAIGNKKSCPCPVVTEYPRSVYPLNPCQGSGEPCPPCSTCPCPPKPPCPPPVPPVPPCPCPIKGNAHVGSGATMLVGGPAGTIPIDTVYSKIGPTICQINPLKVRGPYTYLIEWSGAIDPLNDPGSAKLQLLLDGTPVPGSSNSITTSPGEIGYEAISGGAIVTVPAGCHTLELAYETGTLGAEVANINIRMVQLY